MESGLAEVAEERQVRCLEDDILSNPVNEMKNFLASG